MKENTVNLSPEDYNELRDFRENLKRDMVAELGECGYYYLTKNEEVIRLKKDNIRITKNYRSIQKDYNALKEAMKKHPIEVTFNLTQKEIAKFSILEFIKFRKKQKKLAKQSKKN